MIIRNIDTINYDYYRYFINDVITQLKKTGKYYVFNEKQLNEIKKLVDVKEVARDDFAIYIVRGDNFGKEIK